jgi:septal ring factor EnvC (AmiA/AmiB activator)
MGSLVVWNYWSGTLYSVVGLAFLFVGAVWGLIKWGHRITVRAASEVHEPRLKSVEDRMESFEKKLDGVHTQLNRVERTLLDLSKSLREIGEAVVAHQGYHEGLRDGQNER